MVEEFHSVVLHYNMNISCLMVHAQQVEESMVKKKSRDANRARSYDCGSSKGNLDIQDKPWFKKRFSSHVPSKFPKVRDNRVPNPMSQMGKSGNIVSESLLVPSVGRVMWVSA